MSNGRLINGETVAYPVSSNLNSFAEHQQTGVAPAPSSTGLTQQLAELIVGLEELAATVPTLSIHDYMEAHAQSQSDGARARNEGEGDDLRSIPFSLIRGFQLTQTLINLYQHFQKTSIRSQRACNEFPSRGLSPRRIIDNNFAAGGESRLNHASILLLFSCHHRVADIWALIFSHVRKRAEPSSCEKLRIGSFTPSTKIPLEIVLAIEFQAQLVEHIPYAS